MKKARFTALSWAFVTFMATFIVYGIISLPAMEDILPAQFPLIAKVNVICYSHFPSINPFICILLLSWFVFSLKYIFERNKEYYKVFEKKIYAEVTKGIITGMVIGIVSGIIDKSIFSTINGMIIGMIVITVYETIVGKMIGETIGITLYGTIGMIVHDASFTEQTIFVMAPAYFLGLLAINMMILSSIPMMMALCERIYSNNSNNLRATQQTKKNKVNSSEAVKN